MKIINKNKKTLEEMQSYNLSDSDFEKLVAEIKEMEINERNSSHGSFAEEQVLMYATDKQRDKHPLIMKLTEDGLSDEEFNSIRG